MLVNLSIKGSLFFFFLISSFARAQIPAEVVRKSTLPTLIQEALEKNPEILEAQKSLEQTSARHSQSKSAFYPELGLEGGIESYKSTNESLSNSFGYVFGRYNLYRGGRDRLTLLARSKEEALSSFEISKTKSRISRDVSAQYYALIYLQEAIRVKEEALKLNKSQIQMAEKRARAGITSRADVLEFELREAMLNSDISLLSQDRDESMRELNRLLSRSVDSGKLLVQGELTYEHIKDKESDVLDIALKERADLRENAKDHEVAVLNYKITRSEWLPKIDAEVSYGTLDRRSRVLDQTPSWDAQIKVNIPLFSGLNSYYGRNIQALEVERLDVRDFKIRKNIKTQIESAYARIKAIETRVDLEEKNLERAQQYYKITLSEYQRGVKNSPDLAGAAERLSDSKLRALELRKEFHLANLRLAEVAGIDVIR